MTVDASPAGAEARLVALGLELPPLRSAAGNYVGAARTGSLLFLSGSGDDAWTGRVGDDLTLDQGARAARACTLNLLAQARAALGSLDRVVRVVKVLGFVACTEDFKGQPGVMNGASDLLVEVFGERGRHARSAIGVQALPLGLAVEVEMVLEVEGDAEGA
jgi:enamine deaminase RidA (YjgF/YER057c/UK114 family)